MPFQYGVHCIQDYLPDKLSDKEYITYRGEHTLILSFLRHKLERQKNPDDVSECTFMIIQTMRKEQMRLMLGSEKDFAVLNQKCNYTGLCNVMK